MSFELPITQMAKLPEKAKKPEKSQEELREVLELKLKSLKPTLQEGIKEYEQALKDDVFDDAPGEPSGTGEKRQEVMQTKLTALLGRADKLKRKLDSREILSQATPEISTTYARPDGKKETIILDFETKLQDFISFYQKTNIDLPADFEDAVRDIFSNNEQKITEAIEQNGFDELLIIPPTTNIGDLSKKMKMENGYYFFDVKNDFSDVKSQNIDRPHLVLVHKTQNLEDRTELKKTLNIKGKDVKMDEAMSLEDYIVFQKKYFEETGKHLDESTATWLSSKSGARLVYSNWNPDVHKLFVCADDPVLRLDVLGVRPSRCFF